MSLHSYAITIVISYYYFCFVFFFLFDVIRLQMNRQSIKNNGLFDIGVHFISVMFLVQLQFSSCFLLFFFFESIKVRVITNIPSNRFQLKLQSHFGRSKQKNGRAKKKKKNEHQLMVEFRGGKCSFGLTMKI